MFCVILAALLNSVSTTSAIKPLPSEDSGIAAPFSLVGAAQHLWESTRYGNEPPDKNVPYTEHQHPNCWRMAVHYGWTLWCILYPLPTSLTKQTQTTARSTRHCELLDVLQHQQSSKD